MSSPPCASESFIIKTPNKIKDSQTFEIFSENKSFPLKISYNEEIINFEIEEKNSFPKNEYNLTYSLSELSKIDKYFLLFEKTEEVYDSFKKLYSDKNINLVEEDNQIKLIIHNTITNKDFLMNIPKKIIQVKDEIKELYNYINILQGKINNLEEETKEIKLKNKMLEEKNSSYDNMIRECLMKIENLEQKLNIYENNQNINKTKITPNINDISMNFNKSRIIKKEEVNVILDWIEFQPRSFELILDSMVDGDLTNTFYDKCKNIKPLIIFFKSTDGYRFGGFSNEYWPNNGFKKDAKSFIFSLDKKIKYNIKYPDKAIYLENNYGFAFGENCIFIYNRSSTINSNLTSNTRTYCFHEKNDLNGGKSTFKISSYEVYKINV